MLAKQQAFYNSGATKEVDFRIEALKRLGESLKEHEQQLIEALKKDLNKSAFETYSSEIGMVLQELRFTMRNLKKWMKPKRVKTTFTHTGSKGTVYADPYGVALIIGPWNYPIQLILAPLIGAIAGGNCAMIKPSELTPETSKVLKKVINRAYPERYIAVVEGDAETTQDLLTEKFDYLFFTGSVQVGKIVMEAAAKNLTPLTLELGGKSPAIVHEDADLKLAAKRIAWGKFMNAGQTCVAPDYLYVHQSVKQAFIDQLIRETREIYGETPIENEAYTHIVNQKHFNRLKSYLNQGHVLYGGQVKGEALVIEPTILEQVSFEDEVMQEEIFGPILPIITYETISEVIEGVQHNPNPLALYLFTNSQKIEKTIIQFLSYGGGCINDTVFHIVTPYLPFGGVGTSGMGTYHGKSSFETFTHKKSILKQTNQFDNPFRYPNTKHGLSMIKRILK
nr:aldehyde dehydrogenase [Marinilactibacillus kalidii]